MSSFSPPEAARFPAPGTLMTPTAPDLRFLALGVGDFFSKVRYPTSFVVLTGERPLLIDCPSPLTRMVHEASTRAGVALNLEAIDDVLLTHLHGDHANGLEEFAFYKRFLQGRRPRLYTIAPVAAELWEHRLRGAMGQSLDLPGDTISTFTMEDFFEVVLLDETRPNSVCGLELQLHRTRHFLPCFGFRARQGPLTLGYSCDTTFDPALIDFLAPSNLILHETNFGPGHTAIEKLLALPADLRAKIRLVHISDQHDLTACPIPVIDEGTVYSVAARGPAPR